MIPKNDLKIKAVKLRRCGQTYSEILKQVPVAKSTLSLWFQEVKLSVPQKQRITQKRIDSAKRGGEIRRKQRIERTDKIKSKAFKEVGRLSDRELWLIGTALYWAEGSKEKPGRYASGVDFGNSDPKMIQLYLKWLVDIVHVDRDRISLSLYIHENSRSRIDEIKKNWSLVTGFKPESIGYVYYKKHNPKTVRKNVGDKYWGVLRIRVSKSIDLNRKIMGWVDGMVGKKSSL